MKTLGRSLRHTVPNRHSNFLQTKLLPRIEVRRPWPVSLSSRKSYPSLSQKTTWRSKVREQFPSQTQPYQDLHAPDLETGHFEARLNRANHMEASHLKVLLTQGAARLYRQNFLGNDLTQTDLAKRRPLEFSMQPWTTKHRGDPKFCLRNPLSMQKQTHLFRPARKQRSVPCSQYLSRDETTLGEVLHLDNPGDRQTVHKRQALLHDKLGRSEYHCLCLSEPGSLPPQGGHT